jgi:hypothetical protein
MVHGHFAAAVSLNPLLVAIVAAALLHFLRRGMRMRAPWMERQAISALPWIIVAYGVLRNIPLYPLNLLAPH